MPHTRSQAPSPGGFLSLETDRAVKKRTGAKNNPSSKTAPKATPSKKSTGKGSKRGRRPNPQTDDTLAAAQSTGDVEGSARGESHNGSERSSTHEDTQVKDNGEHPGFSTPVFHRTVTQGTQTPNTATIAGQRLYDMAMEALMSSPVATSQLAGQDSSPTLTVRPSFKVYRSTETQTSPGLYQALYTDAAVETEGASAWGTYYKCGRNILCCPCCEAPVSCPSGHLVGAHLKPKTLAAIQKKLTPVPVPKGKKKRVFADIETTENDRPLTPSQKRRLIAPPGSTPFAGRFPSHRTPTTHAERRRKYTMPAHGGQQTPVFNLTQAVEKETGQGVSTMTSPSANEPPARSSPATPAPATPAPVTPTPATPSTWNFRELFGSVPRTISKLFSNPLLTLRPEPEPVTSHSAPLTPPWDANTNHRTEDATDDTLTFSLYRAEEYRHRLRTQSNGAENSEETAQTVEPCPENSQTAISPKLTVPQDIVPEETLLKAAPPRSIASQAAVEKITPSKASETGKKRKRPKSPDVIPNPKGSSYGMDLDYFVISDSDEESSSSSSGRILQEDAKSTTVIHAPRPAKRVRFDASPQNTPSKLRLRTTTAHSEPRFISTAERLAGSPDPSSGQHIAEPADQLTPPSDQYLGQHFTSPANRLPRATDPYLGQHFADPADVLRRTTDANTLTNAGTGWQNREGVMGGLLPAEERGRMSELREDSARVGYSNTEPLARQTQPASSIPTSSNLTSMQGTNLTDLQPTESTYRPSFNAANLHSSVADEGAVNGTVPSETVTNSEIHTAKPTEEATQEIPATHALGTAAPPEALAKMRSEAEKYKPKTPSTLRESRRNSTPLISSPAIQNTLSKSHDEFAGDAKWLFERCPSGNIEDLEWPETNSYADLVGGDAHAAQMMTRIWNDEDASSRCISFGQILENLGTTIA